MDPLAAWAHNRGEPLPVTPRPRGVRMRALGPALICAVFACSAAAKEYVPDSGNAAGTVMPSFVFGDGFEANLCPDPLPAPGPYMHVGCNRADGHVVSTCTHPEWDDLNKDIADGCEAT